MDLATQRLMSGAAGGGDKVYVDDVFNPFLYEGTDGALTGNSGLDMSGEGGMIWIKNRTDGGRNHQIFDTERGVNKTIAITTGAEGTNSNFNQTFTSTGFTLNNDYANYNQSTKNYCAWNFRKAKGFFDVVTYTGNGSSSGQEVAHSLGSVPGCVIIKCLQSNDAHAKANSWIFYHRSLSDQHFLYWNLNENEDGAGWFQKSDVTSTYVRVPKSGGNTAQTDTMNRNGYSYVMYLFAHDEQSFGEGGDQSIIKCGNFTGNGNSGDYGPSVTLGWEPQFVMIKSAGEDADWNVFDSMRGIFNGENSHDHKLKTENANAETTNTDWLDIHATGFTIKNNSDAVNGNGENIVYVAIRRADGYVGKPPELGSEVFSMNSGANSGAPLFDSTHVVDYQFVRKITAIWNWETGARLIGSRQVYLNTTGAETNIDPNGWKYDYMNGWHTNASGISNYMCWMFKRHAGFDVVTYNGLSGVRQIPHSLGKPAEMLWIKRRDGSEEWAVGHKGMDSGGWNKYMKLNSSDAEANAYGTFNSTAPTATHFSLSTSSRANLTNQTYIAMLFASVEGISKVGSYTGNGSTGQTITLGFQPRFVIIKAINMVEHWEVLDTARGWGSGDDEYIRLSSAEDQQEADYGAPTSTGFTLTSGNNENNSSSGTYIYYAHA